MDDREWPQIVTPIFNLNSATLSEWQSWVASPISEHLPAPPQHSCFISYAHEDVKFSEKIYSDFEKHKIPYWYFPIDAPIGKTVWEAIGEAIDRCDKLLLILSEHSLRSDGVIREIKRALHQEAVRRRKVLLPIKIDNAIVLLMIAKILQQSRIFTLLLLHYCY